MKRAGIYIRVSTPGQAEEGYSVDEQKARLVKYCDAKDWKVVDEYVDAGFSGGNLGRPGMTRLIHDVTLKKIDCVVIYDLKRLARSQKDTMYLLEDVFLPNGVDLVSLSENFDTTTPFGKASIGILAVFAQLDREQIKERMQMGKEGRAKAGKPMSWSIDPFGYKYDKETYIVEELQASIVKQIFADYLSGMSITKLVQKLNSEGHIGKKYKWSYRTVRLVLDNPVYAGYNSFKGALYKGNHEAVISFDDYQKTQEQLEIRQKEAYAKNNNPRPFQTKYMLSGLLRCGHCGATFELILGAVRKDGSRLKRYKCYSQTSKNHSPTHKRLEGCCSPIYQMVDLEESVINQMEYMRANPGTIDDITGNVKDVTADNKIIKKSIESINTKLAKLVDLYIDDKLPIDALNSKRDKLEAERSKLEAKLTVETKSRIGFPLNDAKQQLGQITDVRELDYEAQCKLAKSLINNIVLENNEMTIEWRL